MYKQSVCLTLIVILASGCQTGPSALDQAATMIAQTVAAAPPTNTSLPPATPLPVETSTPKATATPNIALTTTVEAFGILSEVDVHVGTNSGVPYREGYLAWKQNESITIDMNGPQKEEGVVQEIGENVHAADFIFKSDVIWSASGLLICGLAFRAESNLDKGGQYKFQFVRFSGLPAYAIEVYENGMFRNSISSVKFADYIDSSNEATNQFVLVAQDERFVVYINGEQQGQYYDASKQRSEGLLAFHAWQDSGKGSCTFENSWLWILP